MMQSGLSGVGVGQFHDGISMQSATARNTPIEFIRSPFVRFARMEAAGGIVLLASTLIALFWAN